MSTSYYDIVNDLPTCPSFLVEFECAKTKRHELVVDPAISDPELRGPNSLVGDQTRSENWHRHPGSRRFSTACRQRAIFNSSL